MKRIKKTSDLLYFSSPVKENAHSENNVYKQLFTVDNNTSSKSMDNTSYKQNTSTHFNCPMQENDYSCTKTFNYTSNTSQLSFPQQCFVNDITTRKIVKARRLLQNGNRKNRKFDNYDKLATKDSKQDAIVNSKYKPTSKKSVSASITVQPENKINITHEKYVIENEQENPNNISDLLIEALSSPTSPSLSSAENNLTFELEYLHFNSSKEQLYPSTSGEVESSRRTYELEDSVNNISLLKSLSGNDCFRINSSKGDSASKQCKTPTNQKYSKVTDRKKWDKVKIFSPYEDSLVWNSNLSMKSACKRTIPPVQSQSLSEKDSSKHKKKIVSKTKIPNFAAIHLKALNKIESVAEYKQRKETRAKMLLSGRKPAAMTSSSNRKIILSQKTTSPIKKEHRKKLKFAPETHFKEKSPTFIPLPSTPLPKHLSHKTESLAVIQPFRFGSENVTSPHFSAKNSRHTPLIKQERKKENERWSLKNKLDVLKGFHSHASTSTKNGQTMVHLNKKLIMTKSNPVVNTLESRRCAIKGVRLNRRFDLLMNMRKGK